MFQNIKSVYNIELDILQVGFGRIKPAHLSGNNNADKNNVRCSWDFISFGLQFAVGVALVTTFKYFNT